MARYLTAVAILVLAAAVCAEEQPAPADLVKIAEGLSGGLVHVEYTLQYDKGESPQGFDPWSYWRQFVADPEGATPQSFDQLIREERPAERGGFLLSPTRVLARDPLIHPRFIKKIEVRLGDELVPAVAASWPISQGAVMLDLSRPLRAGKPLKFERREEGPYYAVTHGPSGGTWRVRVVPIGKAVSVAAAGVRFITVRGDALIVDSRGTPVGATFTGRLPLHESWQGSPSMWPALGAAEMDSILEGVERRASRALLRVSLAFRSPRTKASPYGRYGPAFAGAMGFGRGTDDTETEWNGLGVLVEDGLVMVLANFVPKKTGRLESIRVYADDGRSVDASFAGTLEDYGAFMAKLEQPLPGRAALGTDQILDHRDELLVKAEIKVHGEQRASYFSRARIEDFQKSWEGRVYPSVAAASPDMRSFYYAAAGMGGGSRQTTLSFLFGTDGDLVALPLARRQKVTTQAPWGARSMNPSGGNLMTPGLYVSDLLADWENYLDPENRPLTDEDENRLAWLGVELQPMNPDLARLNNVSDQTNGGTTGAMVTYIYEGSPAANEGIEVGDILLRLHIEGQPRPLEVRLTGNPYGGFNIPWERMESMMPGRFMYDMPAPWGSAENELTRALTDVGLGTQFTAEFFRDGTILAKEFAVELGPPHYGSARRFKSEDLGLTVRDLTYEVRRYFQLAPDDPGLVISKVEQGEKAAVAGLRPYEIIVSVDDEPVTRAEDFEAAVAAAGDHRLFVKRMRKGRTVKIRSEGAEEE